MHTQGPLRLEPWASLGDQHIRLRLNWGPKWLGHGLLMLAQEVEHTIIKSPWQFRKGTRVRLRGVHNPLLV